VTEFLDFEALDKLKALAIDAELFDEDKRKLLFFRIEYLRGNIQKAASLGNQLRLDLNYLNMSPPRDGLHPLFAWLQNARPLVADTPAQPFVEKLLGVKGGQPGGSTLPASEVIHKETILFSDDLLPVGFMAGGIRAARSVLRLRIPRFENGVRTQAWYWGTGWLISPSLIITNHHVFNARDDGEPDAGSDDFRLQAENTEAQFDLDSANSAPPLVSLLSIEAANADLDFALVRIAPVTDREALVIESKAVKIEKGSVLPLNIIQHPDGRSKQIAIRNNLATASSTGDDIRYFTATLGGSSGSPVFNDAWHVVALHRGSIGSKVLSFQGRTTAVVNLGTRLLSILDKLPDLRQNFVLKAS
jgi:endonuclease G